MLAPAPLRSSHPRLVRDAELDVYRRDGLILLRQVVDARWRRLLRSGIVRDLALPGPNRSVHTGEGSQGRSPSSLCSWNAIPESREVLFHSPAVVGARCLRRGLPWSGLPGSVGLSSEHQRTGELFDEHVFPVVNPG